MPGSSPEGVLLLHALDKKIDVQGALAQAASQSMAEHITEDRENFQAIFARLSKIDTKMAWWGGGVTVLIVLTNIALAALQLVSIFK